MKHVLLISLVFILSLSVVGCGEESKAPKETVVSNYNEPPQIDENAPEVIAVKKFLKNANAKMFKESLKYLNQTARDRWEQGDIEASGVRWRISEITHDGKIQDFKIDSVDTRNGNNSIVGVTIFYQDGRGVQTFNIVKNKDSGEWEIVNVYK